MLYSIKASVMRDVTRAVAEYMIYHLNCCKLSSSWTRKSFDLYLSELYGNNVVFQSQNSKTCFFYLTAFILALIERAPTRRLLVLDVPYFFNHTA